MRKPSLARSPFHHYLVEDENFRRWVEALERGSMLTASVYFRKCCSGCGQAGTTPQEVAKFFLHDLIGRFEKKGVKGSGIESYVNAVKSWMVWNDIETPKSIRIYGHPTTTGTRTRSLPPGRSFAESSTSPAQQHRLLQQSLQPQQQSLLRLGL